MAVTKHLLVAITGHGFGHAAQTAPVIDALCARRPGLRITVRSSLPSETVARFIPNVSAVTRSEIDFGFAMHSAIDVDDAASERAFSALHRDFHAAVAAEAAALRQLAPDLVLANVGYGPIAAAAHAGIPALGFSSLNWLGIARGYCAGWRAADAILSDMAASYRQARCFICPTPAMPMPDFPTRQVGPVARLGVDRRPLLAERLGLRTGERVVLVSLGGIDSELALQTWPTIAGVRYIVAGLKVPTRGDMHALPDLGLSHLDCLASCDAVVGKPGYGTVAEAACHGTPMLFVRRGSWPEEIHLTTWFETHGTAAEITRAMLESGDLEAALGGLWSRPRRAPVEPTGNQEAADLMAALL